MSIIVTLDATARELVREVVREEVRTALAGVDRIRDDTIARGRWITPPRAAREVGISEKAVRHMIKAGLISPRLRNIAGNPKQPKYLVNVDDVAKAAQRTVAPEVQDTEPESLAQRAARIRAKTGER